MLHGNESRYKERSTAYYRKHQRLNTILKIAEERKCERKLAQLWTRPRETREIVARKKQNTVWLLFSSHEGCRFKL